jgi:hypothetical protein
MSLLFRTGEKLMTSEDPFDEAKYMLNEYSSKIIVQQLSVEEAKAGNEVEIMKVGLYPMNFINCFQFLAALVYGFRVTRSGIMLRLSKSVSRVNQLHLAHFVSLH